MLDVLKGGPGRRAPRGRLQVAPPRRSQNCGVLRNSPSGCSPTASGAPNPIAALILKAATPRHCCWGGTSPPFASTLGAIDCRVLCLRQMSAKQRIIYVRPTIIANYMRTEMDVAPVMGPPSDPRAQAVRAQVSLRFLVLLPMAGMICVAMASGDHEIKDVAASHLSTSM